MKKVVSYEERSPETQRLYRVFQRYLSSPIQEGCPCCVDKHDQARLTSKLLSELSWIDLEHFAFKAMTTWGDVPMFKRFLPRILELLRHNPPLDIEIYLGKLRLAGFESWPEDERETVNEFLLHEWKCCLDGTAYEWELDALLCGIVCAGCPVSEFLTAWEESKSVLAYEALAEFSNAPFCNAFWNQGHPEQEQVDLWLNDTNTIARLQNTFDTHLEAEYSTALANAIDAIARYQQKNLFRNP